MNRALASLLPPTSPHCAHGGPCSRRARLVVLSADQGPTSKKARHGSAGRARKVGRIPNTLPTNRYSLILSAAFSLGSGEGARLREHSFDVTFAAIMAETTKLRSQRVPSDGDGPYLRWRAVLALSGATMAQQNDELIDTYVSDQWRIHKGPPTRAAREELRDRLITLIIRAFGSVDSSLDVLLAESPHSNGHIITNLIGAYRHHCLRLIREAVEVHDRASEQLFAEFNGQFDELNRSERKFLETADAGGQQMRAILRTDFCRVPANNQRYRSAPAKSCESNQYPGGVEGKAMDLSDLPENVLRKLAEAEIEAKFISRNSEASALYGTLAPQLDIEEAPAEPQPDEFSEARDSAALHLFGAVAEAVWDRVRPDLGAFKARLDAAKKWVNDKFNADPEVLNEAAADLVERAHKQVAEEPVVSESQRAPKRGVLGAAILRRRQALKEGRLEGYVERPSAAQTFVPRPLLGGGEGSTGGPFAEVIARPQTAPQPKKGGRPVILVDGERIKELRGEYTQPVFARSCKISVDALQRAERRGQSSQKTIARIVKKLRGQGQNIEAKDLIKNTPH